MGHVTHPWLVGVVCVMMIVLGLGVTHHSTSEVSARWRQTRVKSARAPRKVER